MKQRMKPTSEAPSRGSIKDYQDWLVRQVRANVDYWGTGATLNDLAWAERVVKLERRAAQLRKRLKGKA